MISTQLRALPVCALPRPRAPRALPGARFCSLTLAARSHNAAADRPPLERPAWAARCALPLPAPARSPDAARAPQRPAEPGATLRQPSSFCCRSTRRRCAVQRAAAGAGSPAVPPGQPPAASGSRLERLADVLTLLFPVWVSPEPHVAAAELAALLGRRAGRKIFRARERRRRRAPRPSAVPRQERRNRSPRSPCRPPP